MAGSGIKSVSLNPKVKGYVAQLATSLYVSSESAPKCLALTSADAGSGKTSLGLAVAMELCELFGQSTIFVEANLRRPKVADLLNLDNGQPGLAECLSGSKKIDECVVALGAGMPSVMTAGVTIDDRALMTSLKKDAVAAVLDQVSQKFAYVVLETSAVTSSPEAQVFLASANRVVLVVNAGETSRETAALAVRRIEQSQGQSPAIVLNRKQFHLPDFLYKRL